MKVVNASRPEARFALIFNINNVASETALSRRRPQFAHTCASAEVNGRNYINVGQNKIAPRGAELLKLTANRKPPRGEICVNIQYK